MTLPLVLAGPILRRVEPTQASVWIALSKSARIGLQVWEGAGHSGRPDRTSPPCRRERRPYA